ncbi:hypothetical protein Dimus_038223 [Dionaea muscipula]
MCVYVDDLPFMGNDEAMLGKFKNMVNSFDMTDLGLIQFYLGIQAKQSTKGIFLSQHHYARKILEQYGMWHSKPVSTPVATGTKLSAYSTTKAIDPSTFRRLELGSLRYLTCTRPDLLYGGLVSCEQVYGKASRGAYASMQKDAEIHQRYSTIRFMVYFISQSLN